MAQPMTITDLPADILYSIFPYLSAAEFLRLTTSTRALFPYRQDPTFWHALTRKTFRIPPQPLLQGDRWQWLYKKLLTQTRLYTWGDNKNGNLGINQATTRMATNRIRHGVRPIIRGPTTGVRNLGWPGNVGVEEEVGIVADVQCGGWSTTILNSLGAIFIFGRFDGQTLRDSGPTTLRRLKFPPAYPPTTKDRYEPSTAIQQYSTGRSSVLGLSDDGKVWMWSQSTGFLVKPLHVDLVENKPSKVVAGWDRNSMYVIGIGIVYWASVHDSDVLRGGRQEALAVADAISVDTVIIPGTGFRRKKNDRNYDDESLETRIGEVTNYIVLAEFIVFTTDLNKVFCYPTTFPMPALDAPEPVELTTFGEACSSPSFKIRDLQGSFINFAVFTHSGSVLSGCEDLLRAFQSVSTSSSSERHDPLPRPTLVPSLQGQSIISIAFGDHHFQALHANGTISSYGRESQGCGSLGLGSGMKSTLRGVVGEGGWGGTHLPPGEGRTVWFEPLMETWLDDMAEAATADEAMRRRNTLMTRNDGARETFANYFEREGARWEENVTSEDEMGAYFALKVAAAGWHSAALVFVDDEKAERARRAHVVQPSPPVIPTPSPAQSMMSSDSYEVIDAPGEQLAKAVYDIYEWVWNIGRWFLGLTARDAAREVQRDEQKRSEINGTDNSDEEGKVTYTWSNDPFPRLRLPDGREMPGEIPLTE